MRCRCFARRFADLRPATTPEPPTSRRNRENPAGTQVRAISVAKPYPQSLWVGFPAPGPALGWDFSVPEGSLAWLFVSIFQVWPARKSPQKRTPKNPARLPSSNYPRFPATGAGFSDPGTGNPAPGPGPAPRGWKIPPKGPPGVQGGVSRQKHRHKNTDPKVSPGGYIIDPAKSLRKRPKAAETHRNSGTLPRPKGGLHQ